MRKRKSPAEELRSIRGEHGKDWQAVLVGLIVALLPLVAANISPELLGVGWLILGAVAGVRYHKWRVDNLQRSIDIEQEYASKEGKHSVDWEWCDPEFGCEACWGLPWREREDYRRYKGLCIAEGVAPLPKGARGEVYSPTLPANPAWEDHWEALRSWRDSDKNERDASPPLGEEYLANREEEWEEECDASLLSPSFGGTADTSKNRQSSVTVLKVPDLMGLAPEEREKAEVGEWYVSPGDTIAIDQPLVTVETDIAIFEIPSPGTGRVIKLNRKVGDIVKSGDPLAEIEIEDTAETGAEPG